MTSLVFLRYSADVTTIFPWIATNVFITQCDLRALQHNVGTDEDIKNLSERDCNTLRDYDIPIYAEMIGLNKIIVSNLKHYLDPKKHGRW